jgi:Arc/MetJ family transcription regulator
MSTDKSGPAVPQEIEAETEAMLERMRTPEARAAVDALFNASTKELQAMIAEGRLRKATFDGTPKATIDEAIGNTIQT